MPFTSDFFPTLLADLGGTNVRFALADTNLVMPLLLDSVRRYRVQDFHSLADAIRQYFADSGCTVQCAIIAAAGRIIDDEAVQVTNNPWRVSVHALEVELGLNKVKLVNDFAAQAMAVPLLGPEHLQKIGPQPLPRPGVRDTQNFVVMGPGTGLGVAALLRREGRWIVLETEGGHAGFAAQTPEEMAILERLVQRFGRVSTERMICGNGLVNVYRALADIRGVVAHDYTPEDITGYAKDDSDPLCLHAVQALVGMCGSAAGDLVMTLGGWDGVYLTGGVLQVLLPWMQRGNFFRDRFHAKGRFHIVMTQVPTVAVLHPEAGLLGAAALAKMAAGKTLNRL